MKVLYLGHYTEGNTGWSIATQNHILAMDQVGIEVVPRSVKLNKVEPVVHPRIRELEQRSAVGCDVCIQHTLPHHLEYHGHFKQNIAYAYYETIGNESMWSHKLNMMDKVWTSSEWSKYCLQTMKPSVKSAILPFAFDMSEYESDIEPIQHPNLDGKIVYYTIADMNKRKNLSATIKAFHLAFKPYDNVALFIKVSNNQLPARQSAEIVLKDIETIKENMKLYNSISDYISETIITDTMSRQEILSMHASGHIYVNTSHGEGFNIPMFEALAMGNTAIYPIANFNVPTYDFCKGFGYPATSRLSYVFGMTDSFNELYRGNELWIDVDIQSLVRAYKKSYQDAMNCNIATCCNHIRSNYTFQKIGEKTLELLHA